MPSEAAVLQTTRAAAYVRAWGWGNSNPTLSLRDCGADPWQVQKGRRWGIAVDSEKMSKSLGNFFTIRDVLQQYHPLAVRLFLIGTQYRQPINYTVRSLDEVQSPGVPPFSSLCLERDRVHFAVFCPVNHVLLYCQT